jgi:hypothetical protein
MHPQSKRNISHLAVLGNSLSLKQAMDLESELQADPDNLDSRVKLVGYYFTRYRDTKEEASVRKEHILWLIRNMPENVFLSEPWTFIFLSEDREHYAEYKKAWHEQAATQHQEIHTILANAANALSYSEADEALALLQKAIAMAPSDSYCKKIAARMEERSRRDAMY